MTDKKLIIHYKVVAPSMFGRVVPDPDITKYVSAEMDGKCIITTRGQTQSGDIFILRY